MKTIKLLFLMLILSAGLFAQENKKSKEIKTVTMKSTEMCNNCKIKIEKNISFEKGVKELEVDVPGKLITIKYRPDKTDEEAIVKAVRNLGLTIEVIAEKSESQSADSTGNTP